MLSPNKYAYIFFVLTSTKWYSNIKTNKQMVYVLIHEYAPVSLCKYINTPGWAFIYLLIFVHKLFVRSFIHRILTANKFLICNLYFIIICLVMFREKKNTVAIMHVIFCILNRLKKVWTEMNASKWFKFRLARVHAAWCCRVDQRFEKIKNKYHVRQRRTTIENDSVAVWTRQTCARR